jgi:hypothetical protein
LTIRSARTLIDFAVFQGTAPTSEEFGEIATAGLGIRIARLPEGRRNLDFLAPAIHFLRHLDISTTEPVDADIVSTFSGLETLSVYARVSGDVEMSQLTGLTSFSGFHRHFESLDALDSLRTLELDGVIEARLATLRSELYELSVVGSKGLREVPALARPNQLSRLTIQGARAFDVKSLLRFPSLQTVYLSGVGRVLNSSAFKQMISLNAIAIERCAEIDEWESLSGLVGVKVHVEGKNPFDSNFRHGAASSESSWTFPRSR